MQKYYPEVYLPIELIKFNKNWKSVIETKLHPLMPIQPIQPVEPEKPKFDFITLISPPIAFGIFIYPFFKSFDALVILSLLWSALYIFNFLISLIKYPDKIKTYEKHVGEYKLLLSQYNEKLEFREIEILKIREHLNDPNWSYKRRIEFTNNLLKPLKKAEIAFENTRVGRSEKYFEQILKEIFQGAIKTNYVVEIFSYYTPDHYQDDYEYEDSRGSKRDNAYVCDFILEHPNSNLTIDIEIDEPYSIKNDPIHTYGNAHDEKRNKYFTDLGWIIIRFSEEQIIYNPHSCCKEIASLITDLTGDNQYSNKLINYYRIYRHKKWSFSESKNFAELQTRNKSSIKYNSIDDLFNAIKNKWIRNGKIYEIDDDGLIIEKIDSISITDKGIYKKLITTDGRFILDVQWEKSKTKYIIEHCDSKIMIWTDIYSREYIDFSIVK